MKLAVYAQLTILRHGTECGTDALQGLGAPRTKAGLKALQRVGRRLLPGGLFDAELGRIWRCHLLVTPEISDAWRAYPRPRPKPAFFLRVLSR